jgi:hypothetical protein
MLTIQEINVKPSKIQYGFMESAPDEESLIDEGSDKKWARCRSCHYKIALISDKTDINHADTHIFENPAGIFFRVVCFTEAPGTIDISDFTEENTWFNGYTWSITLCRFCNNHLGWHYSSGSKEFYGLIADRLTGI